MQFYGLGYNLKDSTIRMQQSNEIKDTAVSIIEDIGNKHGYALNTGSTGKTKSVSNFIFDYLDCPTANISEKTGKPSMDSESITDIIYMLENKLSHSEIYSSAKYKDIKRNFGKDHDHKEDLIAILEAMQTVQKNSTLVNTHIIGRTKFINHATRRIHSRYGVYTDTSRFSSSDPNAQNIPSSRNDSLKVRNLYQPEEGNILLLVDYAAQEVRISAELYKDKTMRDIIENGWDIHSFTAKGAFNLDIDLTDGSRVEKKLRNSAKPIMFTVTYGGGATALQKTYKTDQGMYENWNHCNSVIAGCKSMYPGIERYAENVIAFARKSGYVETMLGYRRMLPGINGKDSWKAENRAVNTPVQGTAADVIKVAMNNIYNCYVSGKFSANDVKMVATIHDEIAFEISGKLSIESIDAIVETIKECMQEKISDGQEILHVAEPEIADPHDVFGIGASNGWADKYDYYAWSRKVCQHTNS